MTVLVGVAAGQQTTLTMDQKRQLVKEIQQTLATKAFASTVDFLAPTPILEVSDDELREAMTSTSFANLINSKFAKFPISHLDLWPPDYVQTRATHTLAGPGLAVRRGEQKDLRVHEVFPRSPAARAGIRVWDELVAVDGQPLKSTAELNSELGASRILTYRRDGKTRIARLTFSPFPAYRPNDFRWLAPGVAYVSINTFIAGVYDPEQIDGYFRKAAGAKAVVLDLRFNRGGALQNVFDLLGHVLPDGTVVSRGISRETIARSGKVFASAKEAFAELSKDPISEVRLKSKHQPYRGKVIVLTSHLAGSGGDRFPGTVRDLGRGTLIGTRTIGALLTGDREELSAGFVLLYPLAEVLMPSGFRVEGVGVEPHVQLSQRDTLTDERIFKVALEAVKGK